MVPGISKIGGTYPKSFILKSKLLNSNDSRSHQKLHKILWFNLGNAQNFNYLAALVPIILYFLIKAGITTRFRNCSLVCYKSALFCILDRSTVLNEDIIIVRFMKGVFRYRPPQPMYEFTCNVDIVLDFLSQMSPNEDLNVEFIID